MQRGTQSRRRTSYTLIQRSAWKVYSPKIGCRISHRSHCEGPQDGLRAHLPPRPESYTLVCWIKMQGDEWARRSPPLVSYVFPGEGLGVAYIRRSRREDGEIGGPSMSELYRGGCPTPLCCALRRPPSRGGSAALRWSGRRTSGRRPPGWSGPRRGVARPCAHAA